MYHIYKKFKFFFSRYAVLCPVCFVEFWLASVKGCSIIGDFVKEPILNSDLQKIWLPKMIAHRQESNQTTHDKSLIKKKKITTFLKRKITTDRNAMLIKWSCFRKGNIVCFVTWRSMEKNRNKDTGLCWNISCYNYHHKLNLLLS